MRAYLVRFSLLGWVSPFAAGPGSEFSRGTRVLCRTARGLEVGEVLAPQPAPEMDFANVASSGEAGTVVRRMTPEDDLLVDRLERYKHEALDACNSHLAELGRSDLLVDAELLFDGRTLVFYFLGAPPDDADALTPQLAEIYEQHAQLESFRSTLEAGCGPDCGTEQASGKGCGTSCLSCVVATACGSPRH